MSPSPTKSGASSTDTLVLDRTIAARGRYPAVDVTVSLSRVMSSIVDKGHRDAARRMRELVAVYESKRDLVLLGAYAKGTDRSSTAPSSSCRTSKRSCAKPTTKSLPSPKASSSSPGQ